MEHSNDEISLNELFGLLRKGFWLALALALIFATVIFFVTRSFPATYEASARLLVTVPDSVSQNVELVTANAVDPSAFVTAVKGNPVLREALASLANGVNPENITISDIQSLRGRLSVQTDANRLSSVLTLKLSGGDPERVAQEVNAVTAALLNWDRSRATRSLQNVINTLEVQINAIDQQLADLATAVPNNTGGNSNQSTSISSSFTSLNANNPNEEGLPASIIRDSSTVASLDEQRNALLILRADRVNDLNSTRTLQQSAVGLLEIIEEAYASYDPVGPKVLFNTLIAMILGGFLGYAIFFIRQALDTKIHDVDTLMNITGLPVLGQFPRVAGGSRRLPYEKVRYLRTNLQLSTANIQPKVILVTSSVSAEGKSSIALSLAESFVRSNKKTLLIDADMRQPVLHKDYYINTQDTDIQTLADHLKAGGQLDVPLELDITAKQKMHFIPSLTAIPDAPELLAQGIKACLLKWQEQYDVIVVDSAPILPVADSLIIAPHVNITLLITSLKDADRQRVTTALELLQRIGTNVAGLAVTNIERRHRAHSYNYGNYGYGYGDGSDKPPQPSQQRG